jgi:hypothetical protein
MPSPRPLAAIVCALTLALIAIAAIRRPPIAWPLRMARWIATAQIVLTNRDPEN